MSKLLKFIKSNLPYLLLVSIALGLFFGYNFKSSFLKDYVTFVLFLMIYPMMINLSVIDVFKSLSNTKPILISLGLNFLISPIIAFLVGKLFFLFFDVDVAEELLVGMILIGLLPTSGMTASWTGLAKGNLKLSLVLISINLLSSIVIIPFYLKIFLGEFVTIKTLTILKSLIKVVIIPLIMGDLTRRFIINKYGNDKYKKMKPNFGGISSFGVLLIVFISMALKSKIILSQLDMVFISFIPLIIFYLSLSIISHLIGNKFLTDVDRISLVYSISLRNLTIALGLTLSTFSGSLAVFLIAIAYIVQLPIASIYMKLVNKNKG